MTLSAIILVLISACLHVTRSLLLKKSINKEAFSLVSGALIPVLGLPYFCVILFQVDVVWTTLLIWSVGSSVIHCLYVIFQTRALTINDLSLAYPIMRSYPAVVLIFAFLFLGESVSPSGLAGILFVVSGVYGINLTKLNLRQLAKPFTALVRKDGTLFPLLAMLTVAAYSLVDKVAVQVNHPFVFWFSMECITIGLYSLWYCRYKDLTHVKTEIDKNIWPILWHTVADAAGYLCILIALTTDKVSYVSGFRQISIVLAVIAGGRILKEGNIKIRFASAFCICIGAVLIALA